MAILKRLVDLYRHESGSYYRCVSHIAHSKLAFAGGSVGGFGLGASSRLCCCYIILVPLPPLETLANAALVRGLPRDSGTTADAIVILGRGDNLRATRINVAAELWRQGRAPQIFASGRGDGRQMVKKLKKVGIPVETLDDENCSQTTAENADFTAALLQPRGIESIILVTDPPHMLRSLLTFRSAGFRVTPHPSPLPPLPQRGKGTHCLPRVCRNG